MGMSTTAIPFFVDTIAIRPHTATHPSYIGRRVTLRAFAGARGRLSLEQVQETGEYIAYRTDGAFIHGPETD